VYLNVGNHVLRRRVIVGIFDLDTVTVQKSSRAFLRRAQAQGQVRDGGEGDLPKSFVLTQAGEVVLSPLASATLQKRCHMELL
jgi:hypothetical protein